MRRIPVIVGVTALFGLLLVSPASGAVRLDDPASPPAGQIFIDTVAVGGTGCPAGTAAVAVEPDNTAFTVTYDRYVARVGVGAAATDFRKQCQLSLAVHVPPGYTYAISRAVYSGSAELAAGATGTRRATYYFTGQLPPPYLTHTFTGPYADSWEVMDEIDLAALVFQPCDAQRNLNISTDLRVSAGTSDPTTTTSTMTMNATTVYRFQWRSCP